MRHDIAWWRAGMRRWGARVGDAAALDLGEGRAALAVLGLGLAAIVGLVLWRWVACRVRRRRTALQALLAAAGAPAGLDRVSFGAVAGTVTARLARGEAALAALAALEAQHLQVLEATLALQAERRRFLRADRARAASDVLLAAVVRDLPAALVVLDPRGRVCVWSEQAAHLLGVTALAAQGADFLARWVVASDRPTLLAGVAAARAGVRQPELHATLCPAAQTPLEAGVTLASVATPRGEYVAVTLRDRSAAERAATELALAQRLESVGRLAAGIAHEINTPLQFLGASLDYLQQAAGDDLLGLVGELVEVAGGPEPQPRRVVAAADACARRELAYARAELPAALAHARHGLARVTDIVRSMKMLARGQQRAHAPADLNRALEGTLLLLASTLRGRAVVERALAPLPLIACDVGELSQVFVNLLCNAADAIEDAAKAPGTAGTIRVATRAAPGEVVVEISDDGGGIPPAVQDRIFEPFFTTKEVGRGTGQGLAIVRSVVERHRGVIDVETAVGVGTTFRIRLPHPASTEDHAPTRAPSRGRPPTRPEA